MKLEHSFEVRAPIDEVWSTLIDIPRVAPCLPGADISERGEDGIYRGDFKVKLGPTTASYRGTLTMESLDEEAHVATMRADGQDKRGQGSAKATIVSRMSESGGVTRVEVVTDYSITGKLARFGRGGMIKDISNRLLGEFASCLQAGFEGSGGAAAEAAEAVPDAVPSSEAPPAPTPEGEPAPAADPVPAPDPAAPPAEQTAKPTSPPTGEGDAPSARPAFTAPGRSQPIEGLGLVSSVMLDRATPILLAIVRSVRGGLERVERALASRAGRR